MRLTDEQVRQELSKWKWYHVTYLNKSGFGPNLMRVVDTVAKDITGARNEVRSRAEGTVVITGVYRQGSAAEFYEIMGWKDQRQILQALVGERLGD